MSTDDTSESEPTDLVKQTRQDLPSFQSVRETRQYSQQSLQERRLLFSRFAGEIGRIQKVQG